MKLLCTGDWHVHQFTDFSKTLTVKWNDSLLRYEATDDENNETKEMSSRLFNILNGICDMRDYCLKNNIQDVLLSGDVFHKRANIEVVVFNSTYKILSTFKDVGIEVHIIAGNHDQVDSSQIPTSAIHSFKEIAHVIEKPTCFSIQDKSGDDCVEVVAVPYSKDKQFILQSISDLRNGCCNPDSAILLTHLGVTGGKVGSGMYVMSDEYSLGDLQYNHWKYIVLGHYHQPQFLEYNTFYCGTPVQNSFNDELPWENGYNGFFVIDTAKRYDAEFVPIVAPRFITVSSAKELKQYDAEYLENNYIRVKATADEAENIKDTLENILGEDNSQEVRLELEKTYEKDARSDIGVAMPFSDAVKTYANEKYDKDNKNEAIDIGLSILAEAEVGGN